MRDSTAAKVVTVIVNIIAAAGAGLLWAIGCFGIGPISFFGGPWTIYGKNFIWGIFILLGSLLLPIGVNALLRRLHKRYGVSERWSRVPAIIISSAFAFLTLLCVLDIGTLFFTAEWRW